MTTPTQKQKQLAERTPELQKAIERLGYASSHYDVSVPDVDTVLDALEAAQQELVELKKDKERLVVEIMRLADVNADNMEGANMPEFLVYESAMIQFMDILRMVGVKYDPCTGIRTAMTSTKEKE